MSRTRTPEKRRRLIERVETALIVGFAALVVINGAMAVGGIVAAVGRMFLIMLRG